MSNQYPPELSTFDVRIAKAGGVTSNLDLLSSRVRKDTKDTRIKPISYDDLVRDIGKLRQELVLYKESRNAFLQFHHQTLQAYDTLHSALREFSQKVAQSEGDLLEHWGTAAGDKGVDDLTQI